MRKRKFQIKEKIFKWTGNAAWFFIRIDKETSEEIKDNFGMFAAGWGSIPVNVTICNSNWKTSIFPDKGTYLLPVKAKIRKAENISGKDELNINLEIAVTTMEIPAPPLS